MMRAELASNRRPFETLPAIDLSGGRVVRLRGGRFDESTAYGDDPVEKALAFAAAGARWLHVVDLDGARTGIPSHAPAIAAILEATRAALAVEVAGGIRSASAATAWFDCGAARVVVGTAALDDPSVAGDLVREHGAGAVVAAIDVRDGMAVGHGWTRETGVPLATAVQWLAGAGVATFEVTAIGRDGSLGGPDLDLLAAVVGFGAGAVIAAGGIRSIEDLRAVRNLGCSGAIVGRALYESRLDLAAALRALDAPDGAGPASSSA